LLKFFIFARDVGGNALFLMERAFPIFVATNGHVVHESANRAGQGHPEREAFSIHIL
jgi:hypothetical protein